MSDTFYDRLAALGLSLPAAPAAVAAYRPAVQSGNLAFISGQLPLADGKIGCTGRVGAAVSIEEGAEAARLCMLNVLAQLGALLDGDFSRLARVVKLTVFINAGEGFGQHPAVANGASVLLQQLLGDRGEHARSAVGVASLPFEAAVEVEAIAEIRA